ncbi:hypothetical protein JL830_24595 [Vibrio parahaemolyticus]|uniref:hypothetical protein n=1 Tax=Vibrio harveyi group TaxID=717610 RepID=UPI000F5017A4|nr:MULTISPECIES: hypothetical protein [Vibrio harveyi group]EHQ9271300.1 hypothetical protein [Vibrio parahaemolyticus]MCI9702054.1 hypothetical protein [Vibrio parahaemolyticus]MCR9816740.1 hypothetical protein [Vibrio parahaemolyticus]MCZ0743321.1 hypothetical protein [Vibrio diabolicus]RPB32136.1 hypothetical protein CYQ90_23310 [Vibrio parahaemolyticus]
MEKLNFFWSYETIVDPLTGNSFNDYYYKGNKGYRVEVNTPKSKVLASYILIEKDLRSAIFWINSIIEIYENSEEHREQKTFLWNKDNRNLHNLTKGLFVSSLTFYGKCFSTGEGRAAKLEKANVPEDLVETHEVVMAYRHNFAAHSGAGDLEKVTIVTALDIKKKGKPYLAWELNQPDSFAIHHLREFVTLFETMRKYALKKRDTLLDKVYQDDVLSKGMKHWYSKT